MGSTRRIYLVLLLSTILGGAAVTPLSIAYAKDGGDSGGGGGGSDRGGGDDGGGDNHGGWGGGDDDHGGRDSGGDDRGSGRDGGSSGGNGSGGSDYDRARDAVRSGRIMSLKAILQKIDVEGYGRIIDIRLGRSASRDIYQVKLRDDRGVIRTFRVDARNGAVIGRN